MHAVNGGGCFRSSQITNEVLEIIFKCGFGKIYIMGRGHSIVNERYYVYLDAENLKIYLNRVKLIAHVTKATVA